MTVLWFTIPPHTFWGWVFELAIAIGIVCLLGFIISVAADLAPVQSAATDHRRVDAAERVAAQHAAQAIDSLYRAAMEEVRRGNEMH